MKTVNSQPPTPQFSPLALGLALVLGAFTGFAFAADDANNTSRNKTTTHWVTKTADTNDPRNRSWTDKRVHFFGVPARREEAACSLPATTKQRSWGVKKVCNFVRSDLHPQGELRNT